jgi:hypothetical protein
MNTSPDISGAIKSRIMKLAVHVARIGENEMCIQDLVRKPEGKRLTWKTWM